MQPQRKHSAKRDEILKTIRSTKSHPSATWIYEKLKPRIPDLSLGTVYRNLSLFKDEGEIISVGFVEGEERFDGFTHPHSHFACERCNSVIDLDFDGTELSNRMMQERPELHITSQSMVFTGLCDRCFNQNS